MDNEKHIPLPRRTVLRATALAALTTLTSLTSVTTGHARPTHGAPSALPRVGAVPHPAYDSIVGLL